MIFCALVSKDSALAIDLYPSREQAEEALRQALADEPTFKELLKIENVTFAAGAFPAFTEN